MVNLTRLAFLHEDCVRSDHVANVGEVSLGIEIPNSETTTAGAFSCGDLSSKAWKHECRLLSGANVSKGPNDNSRQAEAIVVEASRLLTIHLT